MTVSKETFQGYLEGYPPLEGLMLAQGNMSEALAFCDELQIISNFTLNTLTFDLYPNGEVVMSHVLQNETQESLEAHRELALEYLDTAVDPQVQDVEPARVVAPVVVAPVRVIAPVYIGGACARGKSNEVGSSRV